MLKNLIIGHIFIRKNGVKKKIGVTICINKNMSSARGIRWIKNNLINGSMNTQKNGHNGKNS